MNRFKAKVINYGRQSISIRDVISVARTLQGELITNGPEVSKFEEELSSYIGEETFVVSSGTAALHCIFQALELEPGDEVITPSITFIATQATAMLSGAKIVFADVHPLSGLIDITSVLKKVTSRTKAIVAVDFAGVPCELDTLMKLCRSKGIYLIEDAAHSLGATYKGIKVGSIADATAFSFFPTKNMTTGEGGAVSSGNIELFKKAKRFARQGVIREKDSFQLPFEGSWHNEFHTFGLNYRLTDVMASLGRSQLRRFPEFVEKRRAISSHYVKHLSDIEGLVMPSIPQHLTPNWHFFPILVPAPFRTQIYEEFHKNSIKVQINYIPVHWQPVFRSLKHKILECPSANEFYSQEISLPVHTKLTRQNLKQIVSTTTRIFRQLKEW